MADGDVDFNSVVALLDNDDDDGDDVKDDVRVAGVGGGGKIYARDHLVWMAIDPNANGGSVVNLPSRRWRVDGVKLGNAGGCGFALSWNVSSSGKKHRLGTMIEGRRKLSIVG